VFPHTRGKRPSVIRRWECCPNFAPCATERDEISTLGGSMAGARRVQVWLHLSGVSLHGEGADGSGVVMLGSNVAQASANLGLTTTG